MKIQNISGTVLQINAVGVSPVSLGVGAEYDFGNVKRYSLYEKPVVTLINSGKIMIIPSEEEPQKEEPKKELQKEEPKEERRGRGRPPKKETPTEEEEVKDQIET